MYRSSHSERQRCSCPQGTSPHFLLICGPAEQWPYWCGSFLRCWEAIQLFSQEGGSEDTGISCAKVHISQITVAVGLVGFSYWSATGAIPREPAIIERHSGVLHTEDRFQGKWVNPRDAAMEIIIIIIIQFWIWQVDKGLCPETGWRHDGLMPPSREPGLPVLCDHGDCLLWLLSKVILMPPRWKVFKETFEMLIRSHPNLFFFFFLKNVPQQNDSPFRTGRHVVHGAAAVESAGGRAMPRGRRWVCRASGAVKGQRDFPISSNGC